MPGFFASEGSGYYQVEDEGTPAVRRKTIDFVGAGVTTNDVGYKTVVTIPGGGGGSAYATVEDEGTPLTQRTTINFVGAGVTASDDGSKTLVTISGGGGGGLGHPEIMTRAVWGF